MEDPERRLWRLLPFRGRLHLHAGSLESFASIHRVLREVKPHECYHLAAQSFVAYSFEDEFSTLNTNINGTHYVLSAIKDCAPGCRFYFAGSSEMFGKVAESPQSMRRPEALPQLRGLSRGGMRAWGLCKTYLQLSGRLGALEYLEQPRAAAPKYEALQTFIEQNPAWW